MERAAACTSGNIGERASPKHSEDVDSKQTHRKRSDSHDAISLAGTDKALHLRSDLKSKDLLF